MRPATIDSYQERLGRVLAHIGEHLDEPLTLDRLADVACLSPFHFHRIFSAYLGETVSGHVRRLRLEKAAERLLAGDGNVTETALAVGYETPAAFAKAFRERFGMSPSEFRQRQCATIPPFVAPLSTKEIAMMTAEMREINDTKLLFVRKSGAYSEAAAAAWSVLMGYAYQNRLLSADTWAIGMGNADPAITPADQLRYDACITIHREVAPEGEIGVQTIPGGRYAVFLHKGAYEGLGDSYRSIFAAWLPASGCTLRNAPCFEKYLNRDPRRTKPENLRTEIWLPVE